MKEQLISFETAKLAKEKGFDELVQCGYNSGDLLDPKPAYGYVDKDGNWAQLGICSNSMPTSFAAPTQGLLQKWLREKHEFHIFVIPRHYRGITMWYTFISKFENYPYPFDCRTHSDSKFFSTYEEALEQGLLEALKLIKL